MNDQCRSFTVSDDDAGERLDRLLSMHYSDVSRSRFKELVKTGHARIDGAPTAEPNYRVTVGTLVEVDIPAPTDPEPLAEAIPLDIIYEDDDVIVIDKPSGLVIHPAAGNWTGTLVNALIAHCGTSLSGIGGVRRPGIVHRLDKETTGLLVVAKNDRAHQGLSQQFAAHGRDGKLSRAYVALVWGVPARRNGTVDAPLGRSSANRQKMAVVGSGGRTAITHYTVLEDFAGADGKVRASQIECRLETGRTHQIRVHLAHINHPLLGDAVYGSGFTSSARTLGDDAAKALRGLRRQALHAAELGFAHPVSGEAMRFTAPPPSDYQRLLEALRSQTGDMATRS
jgi:23S rRNA pseudouridine1911/1915/1917 synthase